MRLAYRPLPRPPPIGRYSRRGDERRPAELGRPTPSINVRTTVVGIPDPYEPGKRLLATVNRRTSILEWEESHGRITVAARQAGEWLEGIYEQRSRMAPGSPSQEGNDLGGFAKAAAMHGRLAHMIDRTGPEIIWVRHHSPGGIGELGERLLRHILGDRWTYAECAHQRDKLCGEAGITFVAKSFRNYLEAVADMRAARGRDV